ncbi:L-threonylcarbamoyladenylate synthase [Syntrophomonas palmitatica]|uniref:L-threonylcarbamoyladenylate synthase n=1 Tax=Syntrophomonas palmitatica TaxID=402877 RepID=UPI0006D016A2|nr:Sua5/YciO/YrdC/YwlC family protein [Syntrophomonas palmitatica]
MLETRYIKLDALNPQPKRIDLAANMLKQGQVVAFPTETVYGVGADAWSEKAVLEVFKAKQRPVSNPLLVHVSNLQQVLKLVEA